MNSGASCDANSQGVSTNGANVKLDIPRNWNDSVKLRLGAATWIGHATELHASFAYESSPVAPKYEDPLIFDSSRLEGTLGVRHAFNEHIYAALAYSYVYYLPVTVTNSAFGSVPLAVAVAERKRALHRGALHSRRRVRLPLLRSRRTRRRADGPKGTPARRAC